MNSKTKRIVELAVEKSIRKRNDTLLLIDKMKAGKREINFSSVSKEAGVSRNYLYKNDELRALIETLRADTKDGVKNLDAKDFVIYNQNEKIKNLEKKLREIDALNKKN